MKAGGHEDGPIRFPRRDPLPEALSAMHTGGGAGGVGGVDFAERVLRRVESVRPFVHPSRRRRVVAARIGVAAMLTLVVSGAVMAWWNSPLRQRSHPVSAVVRSAEAGVASGLRTLGSAWQGLSGPAGAGAGDPSVALLPAADVLVRVSGPAGLGVHPTIAAPAGPAAQVLMLVSRAEPDRLVQALELLPARARLPEAHGPGFLIDPSWDPGAGALPR